MAERLDERFDPLILTRGRTVPAGADAAASVGGCFSSDITDYKMSSLD